MNKSQDVQIFSDSTLNNNSNDTLIITDNSSEEEIYFLQYETEEDIYDDERACKLNKWRKSYFSFLEKKINEIEYDKF